MPSDGWVCLCFFFQAEDGIRDSSVTGVQTCALPILDLLHRQKQPCPSRCQRSGEAWWALRAPGRRGLEPASLRGWPPGKLPTLHSATTVVLHELACASSHAPEDGFFPGNNRLLTWTAGPGNTFRCNSLLQR